MMVSSYRMIAKRGDLAIIPLGLLVSAVKPKTGDGEFAISRCANQNRFYLPD
jgi:hypothetical protein